MYIYFEMLRLFSFSFFAWRRASLVAASFFFFCLAAAPARRTVFPLRVFLLLSVVPAPLLAPRHLLRKEGCCEKKCFQTPNFL